LVTPGDSVGGRSERIKEEEMKQGDKVKWVDGMGFEHTGTVDWEAIQWTANPVPVRDKDDIVRWIERRNIEKESP